jgi:hypothetical protein
MPAVDAILPSPQSIGVVAGTLERQIQCKIQIFGSKNKTSSGGVTQIGTLPNK